MRVKRTVSRTVSQTVSATGSVVGAATPTTPTTPTGRPWRARAAVVAFLAFAGLWAGCNDKVKLTIRVGTLDGGPGAAGSAGDVPAHATATGSTVDAAPGASQTRSGTRSAN